MNSYGDITIQKNLNQKLHNAKISKKILSLKMLKMTIKNYFFPPNSWECIVKVFMKQYLQYKSNPMSSYWNITILKNFNQKGDL